MDDDVLISEAAQRLSVSSQYLRQLEKQGVVYPARRVFGYRVYSENDIARLKAMGVGSRPRKLKRAGEAVGAGS